MDQKNSAGEFVEDVELTGHIIDSLILPKVLDEINQLGGRFETDEIRIGTQRSDPSFARLRVSADTPELLDKILQTIGQHGAVPVTQSDCRLIVADMDGAFPDGFYATTNQETDIRIDGNWIPFRGKRWTVGYAMTRRTAGRAVCQCRT